MKIKVQLDEVKLMNPNIKAWLKTGSLAVRAVCFVHIIHTYVYEFTETRGESMLPTLAASNDYVHALKRYRDGKNCKMGDCIVAVKPSDPEHRVCKRITGMPGDVILVDPSTGAQFDRLPSDTDEIDEDESFKTYIKIPKGHVWVTGDNLSHSLDSRTYNSLPMGLIRGKIVAANDFNQPFWGGLKGNFWGFRKIGNSFVDED